MASLDRRLLLRAGTLAGLHALASPVLKLGRCRLLAQSQIEISTRAVDVVLGATVIDMLGLLTLDWPKLFRWHRTPTTFQEEDFRSLERCGVKVFHPAVETNSADPFGAARRWLTGWNSLLAWQPCFFAKISSVGDLLLQPKLGKLGLILGFQDSDHFRTVADVRAFYGEGQRVSQLTYNGCNALGCGCLVARDTGLTDYGASVVAAMNEIGMAIDISHCGDRTSRDAIGASRKPVLVTHSNCRALVPRQPRCKPDSVIRLMAAGGGVMGITTVRAFVHRRASPSFDDLLAHFDHVARLVGIEHVGLGSDVDVEGVVPGTTRRNPTYSIRGMSTPLRVFQIADALLARGYAESDVQLVLGGNFLRALASIWSDDSWEPVPERETRRDPFCPAPRPPDPTGRAAREAAENPPPFPIPISPL